MRLGSWVGLTALAGAVAAGCGIAPTGEASGLGDDAAGASSSSGSSSGSSTGSSSGTGTSSSSSGAMADAHADGKSGGDASMGGGDTGSPDAPDDTTTNDGPGPDAPPDVPSTDAGCTVASDCPKGMACEPDGTCDTRCSSSIPCNAGCCDDAISGNCHATGNGSCNGNGGLCTDCTCGKASDCPQYWACGPGGTCAQDCDPMHLCNGGCCSDTNNGQCVGTDCSQSPEGPVCGSKGFCGCGSSNDCRNSSYGPDCSPLMGVMGANGCGCKCTNGANNDCSSGFCTAPNGQTCPQGMGPMRCQ